MNFFPLSCLFSRVWGEEIPFLLASFLVVGIGETTPFLLAPSFLVGSVEEINTFLLAHLFF